MISQTANNLHAAQVNFERLCLWIVTSPSTADLLIKCTKHADMHGPRWSGCRSRSGAAFMLWLSISWNVLLMTSCLPSLSWDFWDGILRYKFKILLRVKFDLWRQSLFLHVSLQQCLPLQFLPKLPRYIIPYGADMYIETVSWKTWWPDVKRHTVFQTNKPTCG